MEMKMRAFAVVLAMVGATIFWPGSSQAYPDKPIRLIIPFGVGGNNDIVGRRIASQLSEILGEQVLPINHGGAGGVIGTELAAHADRSEEHTSELQSLMRISYAVFCLKKKKHKNLNIQMHI